MEEGDDVLQHPNQMAMTRRAVSQIRVDDCVMVVE